MEAEVEKEVDDDDADDDDGDADADDDDEDSLLLLLLSPSSLEGLRGNDRLLLAAQPFRAAAEAAPAPQQRRAARTLERAASSCASGRDNIRGTSRPRRNKKLSEPSTSTLAVASAIAAGREGAGIG